MTVAEPEAVAVQRIESQVAELPAIAEALVIDSPETYMQAGEFVRLCGERETWIKARLDPVRAKAHAAWKEAVALIEQACAPVRQARKVAGGKMGDYDREQARKRREAEAAAGAERRRLAAEEEARLAAAVAAQDAGRKDEAEAELSAAVAVASAPAPVARYVPSPPKVAGVAMRSYWSAEVTNFRALVEWAAAHPEARPFLLPNHPLLNLEARAQQRDDLGIPGVRGVERREPARTGR